MRTIIYLVAASAALLALASGAAAVPGETETTHEEGSYDTTRFCGFETHVEFTFDSRVRRFYDATGELVRLQDHVHETGVLTGPTGRTVTDNDVFNVTVDFIAGTVTFNGKTYNINVPGLGVIQLGAGRRVIDLATGEVLFEAGVHEEWGTEGATETCAYLAGA